MIHYGPTRAVLMDALKRADVSFSLGHPFEACARREEGILFYKHGMEINLGTRELEELMNYVLRASSKTFVLAYTITDRNGKKVKDYSLSADTFRINWLRTLLLNRLNQIAETRKTLQQI